jgi:hypothetical protein
MTSFSETVDRSYFVGSWKVISNDGEFLYILLEDASFKCAWTKGRGATKVTKAVVSGAEGLWLVERDGQAIYF